MYMLHVNMALYEVLGLKAQINVGLHPNNLIYKHFALSKVQLIRLGFEVEHVAFQVLDMTKWLDRALGVTCEARLSNAYNISRSI